MKKIDLLERYANKNWHIFPCLPGGKKPIITGGFKNATKDIVKIELLNTKNPNANWAVRTGNDSGIFVVDVDNKNGGISNWGKLVTDSGIPKTAQVKTPSGGFHIYFLNPPVQLKCSVGLIAPGIDIRANGGYVLLPGVSEGYEIVEGFENISESPGWLLEMIQKKKNFSKKVLPKTIPEGYRNDRLFQEASALRDRGYEYDEILPAIQKIYENRADAYSGDVDRVFRVMPITQTGHGDHQSGERWLDRKS